MESMCKKFSLAKELKEIVLLAFLGGLVTSVPFCYDCGLHRFLTNYLISACYWVFLAKGNEYLTTYLNREISWLEAPVKRLVWGIVVMLAYTLFIATALYIIFNLILSDNSFREIVSRISANELILSVLITLIISMFLHGRSFYLNWKDALLREEKLKNESLKSQYESLKNQVNPHFLFNSLNALSGLVYDDQEKAVAFIRKMSDVYRYVLEKKDQELVTLEEELQFLKSYIFLQKIRFAENFTIEITPGGVGFVPPLALQLLVENAIKHNVVSKAKPLHVTVSIEQDQIVISNNIQEKLSKDSTGIGLSNLKARYDFLSSRKVEIRNDGKNFTVVLPLLQLENEIHPIGGRKDRVESA